MAPAPLSAFLEPASAWLAAASASTAQTAAQFPRSPAGALVAASSLASAAWPSLRLALGWLLLAAGAASLLTCLAMYAWAWLLHGPNDLARRYGLAVFKGGRGNSWALVTGGSSGIGLALCRKLARQGLNVAVVAVPDRLLGESVEQLAAAFPLCEFRAVPCTLGKGDYLAQLAAATEGLDVRLVFSNAGYMVTGFFDDQDWARHEANIACNATAGAAVAHLFVRRLRAAGARGAVAFTSSPASCLPSPFSCLYGATKAFLTHFATSLAGEVRQDGIDVCVMHPSPVATSFYNGAHAMPTLKMFQATATGPDGVAEALVRGLGRSVVVDHGYYSFAMRLVQRVADAAFLAEVISRLAHTMADNTVLAKARGGAGAGAGAGAAPASASAVAASTAAAAAAPAAGGAKRRKSVSR